MPLKNCVLTDIISSIKNQYYYTNGQVLTQYDCNGLDESNDLIVNGKYFYIHDRLGSVRQVIDTDGTVVNSYTYDPFGQDISADDCNVSVYNPFKFTGQWFDSEIGQYYLRARMYDPVLMRFTSNDPVMGKAKEPLTLHKYLYCINDPVNKIDPKGKFAGFANILVANAVLSHLRKMDTTFSWKLYDKSESVVDAFSMMNLQRGVRYDALSADIEDGFRNTLRDGGIAALEVISPNLRRLVDFAVEVGYEKGEAIVDVLEGNQQLDDFFVKNSERLSFANYIDRKENILYKTEESDIFRSLIFLAAEVLLFFGKWNFDRYLMR